MRTAPDPARARRAESADGRELVDAGSRRSPTGPTTYAMEMDFRFLFDGERKLFAIGFQQATHSLDGSYYDLLASEARLASFIAIAKNDVPVDHWFRLGRTLTYAGGRAGAGVVERQHVRVPDAAAGHAVVPLHGAGPDLRGRGARGRSPTAPSAACRGA